MPSFHHNCFVQMAKKTSFHVPNNRYRNQRSKSSPESDPKLVDLLFFELSQKFDCQEPNQACFDAIFDTDYEHLQRVAWLKSIIAPVAIVIREKTLCMLP